jgi:hypothetical protein
MKTTKTINRSAASILFCEDHGTHSVYMVYPTFPSNVPATMILKVLHN